MKGNTHLQDWKKSKKMFLNKTAGRFRCSWSWKWLFRFELKQNVLNCIWNKMNWIMPVWIKLSFIMCLEDKRWVLVAIERVRMYLSYSEFNIFSKMDDDQLKRILERARQIGEKRRGMTKKCNRLCFPVHFITENSKNRVLHSCQNAWNYGWTLRIWVFIWDLVLKVWLHVEQE